MDHLIIINKQRKQHIGPFYLVKWHLIQFCCKTNHQIVFLRIFTEYTKLLRYFGIFLTLGVWSGQVGRTSEKSRFHIFQQNGNNSMCSNHRMSPPLFSKLLLISNLKSLYSRKQWIGLVMKVTKLTFQVKMYKQTFSNGNTLQYCKFW